MSERSPASHALYLLHDLLTPEQRRELVRVLSKSRELSALWHEASAPKVPGPSIPAPGTPPAATADSPFVALALQGIAEAGHRPLVRDDDTRRALEELRLPGRLI
jgi:hypothetical protein